MTKVVVVYHSGYGHTEKQAKAVLQGVEAVNGVHGTLISVTEIDQHWEKLHQAHAIIMGAPTYMGSVSAEFKKFMEATSKFWVDQKWKDKLAAGFTNSGSQNGDKLNSLVELSIFAAQHAMIWVSLGLLPGNNSSTGSINDMNRMGAFLGAMAQSNVDQPADVTPFQSDLDTAKHLGKRVAELAQQFRK
ncbi:flavodoxin family protein [Candidatus Paracaedibacter symbiosus]|uniref:flavodoxin family protein n=1 Tax=Candidatus Paracaedibacter symbiosus TaxID=244582 RepID=UPI000509D6F8|nr:flavodoxin family protein [Candidatus Paracaedibacter symbiosus]